MERKSKNEQCKKIYEEIKKEIFEKKYEEWIFKSVGKNTYFFDSDLLPVLKFDHSMNVDYVSLHDPILIILEYTYDQEILNCNAVFFSDDGEPRLAELGVFPKHKSDEDTNIDFFEKGDLERRDMVLNGIKRIVPSDIWGELIQKLLPIWKRKLKELEEEKEKERSKYIKGGMGDFSKLKEITKTFKEKADKDINAEMDEAFNEYCKIHEIKNKTKKNKKIISPFNKFVNGEDKQKEIFPAPSGTKWDKIYFIVSEVKIRVKIGDKSKSYTPDEFKKITKIKNNNYSLLLELIKSKGILSREKVEGQNIKKYFKQYKLNLKKFLKDLFGIYEDPIIEKGGVYTAKFKTSYSLGSASSTVEELNPEDMVPESVKSMKIFKDPHQ